MSEDGGISRQQHVTYGEFQVRADAVDNRFMAIEAQLRRIETGMLARIERLEGRINTILLLLIANLAGMASSLFLLWLRA